MLSFFKVRRNFNALAVSITVDCDRKEAELMISAERRIIRMERVDFDKVRTPELADAYFGQEVPCGDGTLAFIEYLDWQHRRGLLKAAA